MLLVGDVGATKTRLAVIEAERGPRALVMDATFASAEFPDLEELIRAFLARAPRPVERACLAVAGPVLAGQAHLTNLPWVIEATRLQATFGLREVRLLNDLVATAEAVLWLTAGELASLQPGEATPGGVKVVIAPGTGLGQAMLVWDGTRYRALPSEGGHASFAPTSDTELALLRTLRERFDHASVERVCSGMGLPNLYGFLRDRGDDAEPAWLAERLAGAADPTPIIIAAAQDRQRPCPLCAATLDLFVDILGAAAGNLALTVLATGGVYLGGGLPPRLLPELHRRFQPAFRRKGRLSKLLERLPVQVILNPDAALLGAAHHGLTQPAGAPPAA